MIKALGRGSVVVEFEGRTAVIRGEAYLRGRGSPDFVMYESSLSSWEAPHHLEPIDAQTKKRLLTDLIEAFRERGIAAVVERSRWHGDG